MGRSIATHARGGRPSQGHRGKPHRHGVPRNDEIQTEPTPDIHQQLPYDSKDGTKTRNLPMDATQENLSPPKDSAHLINQFYPEHHDLSLDTQFPKLTDLSLTKNARVKKRLVQPADAVLLTPKTRLRVSTKKSHRDEPESTGRSPKSANRIPKQKSKSVRKKDGVSEHS